LAEGGITSREKRKEKQGVVECLGWPSGSTEKKPKDQAMFVWGGVGPSFMATFRDTSGRGGKNLAG